MKVQSKVIAALAILIATGCACLAGDEKTDAKQSTVQQTAQIQADKIDYNADTKEITASGRVVITMKDGSTITTEKAVVKTDDKGTSVMIRTIP